MYGTPEGWSCSCRTKPTSMMASIFEPGVELVREPVRLDVVGQHGDAATCAIETREAVGARERAFRGVHDENRRSLEPVLVHFAERRGGLEPDLVRSERMEMAAPARRRASVS